MQQTADNASKLHRHVGKLLTSIPALRSYEIRQEYRVSDINPDFKSNREKVDWVILGVNVAVEVMGEQHYRPVQFGGRDISEAKQFYRKTIESDEKKRQAILDAGWTYITVKYNEKSLTAEALGERVRQGLADRALENSADLMKKIMSEIKVPKKPKKKTKWPSRKLESRPFPRKQDD